MHDDENDNDVAFDEKFPEITIVPEWLSLDYREVERSEEDEDNADLKLKSEKLLPRVNNYKDASGTVVIEVPGVSDLIPGDWVYFQNYLDYQTLHPGGAFSGENAVYMGAGKYRGFGVDSMTFDQMVNYLQVQFNNKLPGSKQKMEREAFVANDNFGDDDNTFDSLVPGISKSQIRRYKDNIKK